MDFTDPYAVHDAFSDFKPEVVVHGGATSKPDDCELDQWKAFLINVEGTLHVLANAEEQKSFFVFLSTDFILDGEVGMYREEEAASPINYYGKTKEQAEAAVMEYAFGWSIVRTVLVYGKPILSRSNILSIVRDKLEKGESYNVVDDQVRTPTYVGDLAEGILRVIQQKAAGIYHIAGKDIRTPYQMAIEAANFLGLDASLIRRVTADSFTQPAKRPLRTGFRIDKARKELGYEPITFEEGLRRTFS